MSKVQQRCRNHSFEVLRTANQQYGGVDFFVIKARLPAHGLSATENWCRDYQNLCAEYGRRPTGCGEDRAVEGGTNSIPGRIRCVSEYNSDPYINNVLGCEPYVRVAEVANMAFSAGALSTNSFGFNDCRQTLCQRGIHESHWSLTVTSFGRDGTGDRTVHTVCTGYAEIYAFEVNRTANIQYEGIDFLAIEAKLPADGLSATENWCRDYQNLCAEYGMRPTGCGEDADGLWAGTERLVSDYNSDPYTNNVLGCPPNVGVAAVANLAFSAGAAEQRSFGFYRGNLADCQRGIYESRLGLKTTEGAFAADGTGDRIVYTVCAGSVDIHAFEVLRTANQQYEGIDFLAIEAKLPVDGLSATENWCWDYRNLCAEYGRRPTGCGESWAVEGGRHVHQNFIKCVTTYNSDPYINNVLRCTLTISGRVAEVANLAFSAGATRGRSFGFYSCQNWCKRQIQRTEKGLRSTEAVFSSNGTGDRIVYTLCAPSSVDNNECGSGNGGCAHRCIHTQSGHRCICPQGFSLMADGHGCEVDECATNNGGCAQTCTKFPGNYTCSCRQGFVLMSDGHGCEAT
ncbi:uncharacterized protein LOC144866348 [Branchiostoma floridae x Branchiostoma japonicum]